jgi:hypothetical protein
MANQQPESSTKSPPDYKQQLDQAATTQSANDGNGAVQSTLDTVIDKGTPRDVYYLPRHGEF